MHLACECQNRVKLRAVLSHNAGASIDLYTRDDIVEIESLENVYQKSGPFPPCSNIDSPHSFESYRRYIDINLG